LFALRNTIFCAIALMMEAVQTSETCSLFLVSVPPMLWIPHQLVGAPLGYSVTLECFTEAHPTSLNYWTREDGHMIHDSRKYRAENTVGSPSYKTHMKLTISNIQERDYGTYKCVAKNPRGETDGTIRLYSEYTLLRTVTECQAKDLCSKYQK
jgi:hypothetical protein